MYTSLARTNGQVIVLQNTLFLYIKEDLQHIPIMLDLYIQYHIDVDPNNHDSEYKAISIAQVESLEWSPSQHNMQHEVDL